MAITQDDFKKVWASTSSVPEYTFSDSDYQDGWEFVGNLPPTRAMWDTLQRRNDQKMKYLQDNGSMCFDSVADMKSSNLDAGQTAFTKGYHDINDGGAGTYSIRGKVAGETEDGGSVIFLENGNVAELIITDEVNINQFGGKGDGTTDDSTAIVNAVAFASAKKVALRFLAGKTYYTSVGITITGVKKLLMDGTLYYTGSGVALTINGGSNTFSEQHELNVRGNNKAGSTGVKLVNFTTSQVFVKYIFGFDIGLELNGNAGAFAYNSLYIDLIGACPVSLKINSTGTGGYVNENKFFGGRFYIPTSAPYKSTAIGILITSDNNYINNNNNTFYSPSLEVNNAVKIEYGAFNQFLNCRTEGSTNPFIVSPSVSNLNNYMSTSHGLWYGDDGYGNVCNDIRSGYRTRELCDTLIFDSGDMLLNYAKNASKGAVGKMLFCYKGNVTSVVGESYFDVADGMLSVSTVVIGFIIDSRSAKNFYFHVLGDGNYRPTVFMWDSEGNLIENSANLPRLRLSIPLSYQSASGAGAAQYGYRTGANTTITANKGDYNTLTLPSNCSKAFIGIAPIGTLKLSRFMVYGQFLCNVLLQQCGDNAVLDSIPTSVGTKGQFVGKKTPTAGEVGWVYDGNQWLAVG